MLVKNLTSANYFSSSNLAKSKKAGLSEDISAVKRTGFSRGDVYIPSADGVKAKNLSEIRTRISSGFYNSNEVNDDLTEFFSNVFKKAL